MDSVCRSRTFRLITALSPLLSLASTCFALSSDPAVDRALAITPDIEASARRVQAFVESDEYNAATCLEFLTGLQTVLYPARIQDFDLELLKTTAPAALESLWRSRLAMHGKLASLPEACVHESRAAFRVLRFIEDYVAEWYRGTRPARLKKFKFKKQPTPIKEKSVDYLMLTKDDQPFEFENGDILITRGVSFLSASIARVGASESQFSHVVLFHRGIDGQEHTIESYVGDGVGTFPINDALRNENARIVVLRAKNSSLADRAANLMWEWVTSAIDQQTPIDYDFAFDWDDHEKMSCAEVARAAFREASHDELVIPEYPSQIQFENTDFIDRIGMKNGWTFSPGDLEVDSRFDLVAEWRDLRLTRDSRQKDAVLTSMFKWMEEDSYVLQSSFASKIANKIVWPTSHTIFWPLVRALTGAPRATASVPRRVFETVAILNQVGDALVKKISELDAKHEQNTGWPMNMTELYESIEAIKSKDLVDYQAGGKARRRSVFHKYFRDSALSF